MLSSFLQYGHAMQYRHKQLEALTDTEARFYMLFSNQFYVLSSFLQHGIASSSLQEGATDDNQKAGRKPRRGSRQGAEETDGQLQTSCSKKQHRQEDGEGPVGPIAKRQRRATSAALPRLPVRRGTPVHFCCSSFAI
jgi:hypothetical protein